jgi:hypothetical protein
MKVNDNVNEIFVNVVTGRKENVMTSEHAKYLMTKRLGIVNSDNLDNLLDAIMNDQRNAHLQSSKKINELFDKILKYIDSDECSYITIDDLVKALALLLKRKHKGYMTEVVEYFGRELLFG